MTARTTGWRACKAKRAQDVSGRPGFPSARLRHMVGFVNNHEADTPACGHIVRMTREGTSGVVEHHVDSPSAGKPLVYRAALSRRRLTGQGSRAKTELFENALR